MIFSFSIITFLGGKGGGKDSKLKESCMGNKQQAANMSKNSSTSKVVHPISDAVGLWGGELCSSIILSNGPRNGSSAIGSNFMDLH